MIRKLTRKALLAGALVVGVQSAQAVPVDLELLLAADVSGSINDTDFSLQRSGFEAAFRNAGVISAIESGAIGSIAVTLWDFATTPTVAVDWTTISDATTSNAFADAVAAAARGGVGINDGQSNLIDQALVSLNGNNFEGTRSVLDIASEGAQDIDDCVGTNVNCPTVQDARDAFLAGGGTTINAIWLNDRNFFGLDPADIINAFEYGTLNVIGGPGAFQSFAFDFTTFGEAIEAKIVREIVPVPEPGTLALIGLALVGLSLSRRAASH